MKKKLMSILTATAITLSAIPYMVSAETTEITDSTAVSIEDIDIVAQGKCGENAEWTIDNNGTLVISGTGRTKYDYSNMLFSSYSDKIVNAVVGEGITSIDICFFMNCKNLKSVTLPESLESILGGAFDNCENLSEINIPENTTYIAGNVFKDTLWLENKRAENPLVIVNNMVIDGKNCKGNVVIPDGVTTILGGAFENATDISSVKIPETVTDILEYAFINCTSLKSVKLPNGITKIKVLCFAGCSSLESVEIPASVEIIENDVFFGCTALKEIEIPQNTIVYSNSIGYYGESECKKIEDIILKGYSNSPAQAYAEQNEFKFVAIDEDTDTTEIVAQGECGDATWTLDSNGTLILSGTGFADPDHYFSTPFRDLADEVTAVVINDGITTLEPYLFKDFSNLKTVSLPDGLLAIYKDVFENCENLTEINIPDSVIYIGAGAFENTAWLKSKQSENPLVIGGNVVIDGKGCKGDVVIPDGITAVGSGAFEWCTEITSVKLPDSLTFIGEYAFYHCELIETLDMPKNVSVIKEYAFSECGSLKSIDIPDGVKYIYENTFEGCYLLEKVTLPESLLFIGENAFRDCESLKEMGIPSKAEICRYAVGFSGSDNEMITDFVIKGYKGTFAETYAEENGFKFVAIDEKTDEIKGDANCDGNINMADAVLIMQSLANPDKYGVNGTDDTHITAQGEKNGDMDGNGLTNADALEIQKMLLKIS